MCMEPHDALRNTDYIDLILGERTPRMVVTEAPSKVWSAVYNIRSQYGIAIDEASYHDMLYVGQKAILARNKYDTYMTSANLLTLEAERAYDPEM